MFKIILENLQSDWRSLLVTAVLGMFFTGSHTRVRHFDTSLSLKRSGMLQPQELP